jgi:crotonobetainyl-CoA:carnitine CoA-transferase CaiB-like acyl-CoA transferase
VDAGFRSPPPDLGQDTEAVLRALLGYDEARLDALRVSSAIP